jgi:hypothetical protein
MSEGLIVARSRGELRKAAACGQAYYSCERFEDGVRFRRAFARWTKCLVRVRNQAGGLRYTLAVSLKAGTGGSCDSYLLRFAEVDGRGRPRPIPLEYRCLTGPRHPEYEGCELEVIEVAESQRLEALHV